MKANLVEKVSESFEKIRYEISYYTGIGWRYKKGSYHYDFRDRKKERYYKTPDLLSENFDV